MISKITYNFKHDHMASYLLSTVLKINSIATPLVLWSRLIETAHKHFRVKEYHLLEEYNSAFCFYSPLLVAKDRKIIFSVALFMEI